MTKNENKNQAQYDDEISLVDLATTFLRRRRVFYVAFLVMVVAGIGYAIVAPPHYEYTSLVKLAEKESHKYIEEPVAVIAELESHWLPEYQAEYLAKNNIKLPFKVTFSNPDNTGLVQIVSEAPPDQMKVVEKIHSQLMAELEKGQGAAVSRLRQSLEKRIESLDTTISMLKGSQDAGPSIAAAIEQRLSLENELESIRPMELLVASRQGADSKGLARSLIVVLAGVLGLMAGVFLAFFAEFVGLVKEQMAEA